eukprot:2533712-Rhodomonas_salina.1
MVFSQYQDAYGPTRTGQYHRVSTRAAMILRVPTYLAVVPMIVPRPTEHAARRVVVHPWRALRTNNTVRPPGLRKPWYISGLLHNLPPLRGASAGNPRRQRVVDGPIH